MTIDRDNAPAPMFAADLNGLCERREENLGVHNKLGVKFSEVIPDDEQTILIGDARHLADIHRPVKNVIWHNAPPTTETIRRGNVPTTLVSIPVRDSDTIRLTMSAHQDSAPMVEAA